MKELNKIIEECFNRSKPPVALYSQMDDGSYYKISDKAVADIKVAKENLQTALEPFLKEYKEQELMLLKNKNSYLKGMIRAYEKFLKDKGYIEEEEE